MEGPALLLGVDRFMSEARAIVNMIVNGIATAVAAKSEKEYHPERDFPGASKRKVFEPVSRLPNKTKIKHTHFEPVSVYVILRINVIMMFI